MSEEGFKRMDEVTAKDVCAVMDEFVKTSEEIAKNLAEYNKVMSRYALERVVDYFLDCIKRYVQATFLTKWWYKRKLNKAKEILPELEKMITEAWEEKE